MSSSRRSLKFVLAGGVAAVVVAGAALFALVPAQDQADKAKPDYQGFDLTRPWFDGKRWDWFLDMFNQPSIKPQEEGTFQAFPVNSVPRSGAEPFIAATAIVDGKLLRDQIPPNPTRATPDSVARGRVLYETYCGVCHGNEGQAGTPVVQRGMPAPPIQAMLGFLSEAHLYNKIRFGGPIMPTYGFQTSMSDRWDMVNYLKSSQFGKGPAQ